MTTSDATTVDEALRPLSQTLEADGYRLVTTITGPHAVRLDVEAGPEACADCLVPKEVFSGIAAQRLSGSGDHPWDIELRYPADGAPAS